MKKILIVLACLMLSSCEALAPLRSDLRVGFNQFSEFLFEIDRKYNRKSAVSRYDYDGRETLLSLEEMVFSSETLKPGDQVDIDVTATVLLPNPDQRAVLVISRSLFIGDIKIPLGKPKEATVLQGTVVLNSSLIFPEGADKGSYIIEATVTSAGVTKQIRKEVLVI